MFEITPEHIFNNLVGRWSVTRTCKGQGIPNEEAHFSGTAEFSRVEGEDNLLLYEEFGKISFGDQSLEAEQRYFYGYDHEEKTIKKWFYGQKADRFFHDLSFSGDFSTAHGVHKCGEDTYKASYYFQNGIIQSLKYAVASSAEQAANRQKNYVIETFLQPI